MTKPTVHYDYSSYNKIIIGYSALIKPIDHPDSKHVSNKKFVMTSPVISLNEDGSFETQNTIYVPRSVQ